MSRNQVKVVGIDVFVIAKKIPKLPEKLSGCTLTQITNRGGKVWPGPAPAIALTDLFTARYECGPGKKFEDKAALKILSELSKKKFMWVHVEKLLEFNGVRKFS